MIASFILRQCVKLWTPTTHSRVVRCISILLNPKTIRQSHTYTSAPSFLLIIKYYEKWRRRKEKRKGTKKKHTYNKRWSRRATEKQMQNASLRKERKIIYSFVYSHRGVVCVLLVASRFSSFCACIYTVLVLTIQFNCVFQNQLSHFRSVHATHHTQKSTRREHREKENSPSCCCFFFSATKYIVVAIRLFSVFCIIILKRNLSHTLQSWWSKCCEHNNDDHSVENFEFFIKNDIWPKKKKNRTGCNVWNE